MVRTLVALIVTALCVASCGENAGRQSAQAGPNGVIVLPTPKPGWADTGCPQYEIRKQRPDGTPCATGPGCTYHVFSGGPCPIAAPAGL